MASLLDGTLSAEEYNAPKEMRAYQGALRASGKVEPASASDNWAQKGLSEEILAYNERRALARAKSREAYESAEKVMADRAEKKGAESSAIPEHMYWAEVEAPMLFGLTDAHREEIELITLSDLHAGCAYRLSTLASVRGQVVGTRSGGSKWH